ncbi:ABC-type maltose/maltodextrin transporter ATP-binding protein MalK [Mycoplasmopsis maculosa]|uniref:ABC-type maltose/maltodextrin transporter ATP-binding protein MalK n=1 Tax=Mycoplasmopsis maculosa TaxID=114885 RepID=A0A449B4A9_9BACT|nr:ABC transporter ATP-binding protein [Mycoplasmopsis maculosa]VEU75444.1 ABC-type maltose/maltodextrin transporter ATP-binding protein MalK [Mycoplasmopsis maculosa]
MSSVKNKEQHIIELKEIVKEFDNKIVLDNVDLKINKGDFVTLLGPSGSGKTTILRLIAGFEKPTRGEILFEGLDIKDLPPHKRDLSTIFQDYALFPHLNVEGNIKFAMPLKRIPRETVNEKYEKLLKVKQAEWSKIAQSKIANLQKLQAKYEEDMSKLKENTFSYRRIQKWLDKSDFNYSYWENYVQQQTESFENRYLKRRLTKEEINREVSEIVKLVGLEGNEKRAISELSGGMKQRVALARSLIIEPSILLLDEPLSALDAKIRQKMQVLLRTVQKKLGLTFIFVTHDQDEALELSDKVAVMRGGKIEQYDTPKAIYDYPVNKWVASFVGDSNIYNGIFHSEDATVSFLGNKFKTIHNEDDFKDKQEVDVLIRPEDIDIISDADSTSKATNRLKGNVVDIAYRGSYYYLKIILNNNDTIYVETSKKFELGETVQISWTIDSVHLMEKDSKWDYSTNEFKN